MKLPHCPPRFPMLASQLYVPTLLTKSMVWSDSLVLPEVYFLFQDPIQVAFGHPILSDTSCYDSLGLSYSECLQGDLPLGCAVGPGWWCGRQASEASVWAGYLHHQVDSIWNLKGDTPPGMYAGGFQRDLTEEGIALSVGGSIPWTGTPY